MHWGGEEMSTSNRTETRPARLIIQPVGWLLLIFAAVYFVELATFPLSIDEELFALSDKPEVWIAQSRWGAYLVEAFFLPQPIIPFLPPMIFGVCCVASYLLLLDLLHDEPRGLAWQDYAAFFIYCGFPTWFFLVEFYTNIHAGGLGLLACTMAVWLIFTPRMERHARSALLAAIATGAFAISIYQSFVFCMAVMALAVSLLLWRNDRLQPKPLIRLLLLLIGSTVVFYAIDVALRRYTGWTNPYLSQNVRLENLLADPVGSLRETFRAILRTFGVGTDAYGRVFWGMALVAMLGCATLVYEALTRSRLAALITLISIAAMIAIPFALHPFAPIWMPMRSLVGVPVAAWALAYAGMTSPVRLLRWGATTASTIAIFQLLIIQNAFQASNYFTAKHDVAIATAVYSRLADVPQFDPRKKYSLAIFGGLDIYPVYARPNNSMSGRSFFEFDAGRSERISSYLALLNLGTFRVAGRWQVARVVEKMAGMPVWPARDSVQIDGNVVLIRLGELPTAGYAEILKQAVERQN